MDDFNLNNLPKINVILICGIPGAGKTYLTNLIKNKIEDEILLKEKLNVENLSFDELFLNDQINLHGSETKFELDLTKYNKVRKDYFNCYINTVDQIKNSNKKHILLLDDNFHFKSMRKPFYKNIKELSLKNCYEVSYLEIHLSCSLAYAIKNNSNRKGFNYIPESVIIKMFNNFQFNSFIKDLSIQINPENSNPFNNSDLFFIFQKLINNFKIISDLTLNESLNKLKINKKENKETFIDLLESKIRKITGDLIKANKDLSKEISIKKKEFMLLVKYLITGQCIPPVNSNYSIFNLGCLIEQVKERTYLIDHSSKILDELGEEYIIYIK